MAKINVSKIKPEKKLFHNEKINVYPRTLKFQQISYWPENLRTILAFDLLIDKTGKKIDKLDRSEVTKFLAGREELQLTDLADSIERNGVRVPLIVLDDGTLLDGNRRYFACSYLYDQLEDKKKIPTFLSEIPVFVIKKNDINDVQKQKILAEANFVNDLKLPWTHDVKALVISNMYKSLINEKKTTEEAYDEIEEIYSLKKSEAKAYVDIIQLSDEYIDLAKDKDDKFKRRAKVLKKFVYFWEFRNKGLNGRSILEPNELNKVKPLFFKMIELDRFANMKQVEPMIRSVYDPDLWEMLSASKGQKMAEVELLYREQKTIKSSEDKTRNFSRWLSKEDPKKFTKATYGWLDEIIKTINKLKMEQHK